MAKHSLRLLSVIGISWLIFLITLTINALSANGGVEVGWFRNNTGEISDKYPTLVTPAGWTFSLWGIIYFFQVGWMVYLLTTVFRRSLYGEFIYNDPGVIPWPVHVFYIFANISNIVWLFLWDRQLLGACLPVIALIPFNLFLAALVATRSLAQNEQSMLRQSLKWDLWLNRIFVHNGLAIYTTWTAIATLINLASVLIYRSPVNATIEDASVGSLSVLIVELVLWSCLDVVFFDRYTRYIFTPYFVVVFALIGILSKNNIPGSRATNLTIALLVLASIAFVVKILVAIVRSCRKPNEETQPVNLKKSEIEDK